MTDPTHLRVREIAADLGMSERTIRRWISDGTLPSSKLGGARLVARADLERLLAAPDIPPQEDGDA